MLVKDDGNWNRIIQRGEGFIYNDFGTQLRWNLPDVNKLRKASYRWVRTMTYVSEGKLVKYFFKTTEEAIDWL